MKYVYCFLLMLFCCVHTVCAQQKKSLYVNPVLNADFSDPDVIRVGNTYYMVASDFHFMGMQVMQSEDLVHWRYISQVYKSMNFPEYDNMKRYAGGSWAPALRYHNGEFYIFFCTPKEGLFMTHAKSAEGPWAPLYHVKKIAGWEDPCPFWDEDGQAYLGHSKTGAGPIILHKMSEDGKKLLDDGVEVYRGPVAEGTKIHKFNGVYYFSIPEGGVKGGWQTILRSQNLYGPYERKIVLETGSTKINGPHQGAIVDTPEGEWKFFHFQETDALGRVVHLQPMYWREGWPVIGEDYDRNGVGEPVAVGEYNLVGETYSPQTSDDFCEYDLGLQWQFNHNPTTQAYSLREHPGMLTLYAQQAKSFKEARNTLTQKSFGNNSEFTVALNLTEMKDGQRAGIACMSKNSQLLGVLMQNGILKLYVGTDTTEQTIEDLPEFFLNPKGKPIHPVYLRLSLDMPNKKFQFAYSKDGYIYNNVGEQFYQRWGHWKGVRPALYTYTTKPTSKKNEKPAASFFYADYKVADKTPQTSKDVLSEEEKVVSNIARTSFPERIIKVAKSKDDRREIQHAIDSCSLLGGGHVQVLSGTYNINGNIVLKSNVDLHLEKGTHLLFSGVADDFLPVVFTRWEGTELYGHSSMIYAHNAVNIAITGEGMIDAQAGKEMAAWAEKEVPDRDRLRAQGEELKPLSERIYGKGTILRPACVEFIACSRILLQDITIKNSPFWTIHPVYCDNVIVRGITIDTHFANNDGCDPESTSNVLIENCVFNVGDDAIAIKAGRDADGRRVGRASQNIVIRDCLFNSECNGLCIGSEMSGGVENVFMHDIQIGTVKNAIYFKSNRDRGGYIRNIYVNDITVQHALGAVLRFETNYFGFRGGNHASQYEHFRIRNIDAWDCDDTAFYISGYPEKPVKDIIVENAKVRNAKLPYYMHCTKDIQLRNCFVNNKQIPVSPSNTEKERTIDVW